MIFLKVHNTTYVTKVIQKAHNDKMNAGIKVDDDLGPKTTAIIKFIQANKLSHNG
jgi:hypothetical protein